MTTPATTTCDACGRRYSFTSHKDRCPVCCPKEKSDDCFSDELTQETDWPDIPELPDE